jgi:hypothetical protein
MFQLLKTFDLGLSAAQPYVPYGSGEFDGQGSGHDFYGTLYHPPSGYVNNCDGGRSHLACDVSLPILPLLPPIFFIDSTALVAHSHSFAPVRFI